MINNRKQPNSSNHSRFLSFFDRKPVRSVLSVCVAAATVSSLILPAITLNQECKLQEHQHSEACYTEIEPQLTCTYESMEVHVHEDGCYNQEENLICGIADFVIHTHDDFCYDKTGAVVCQLPEVEAHQHEDSCYETPDADPGHKHEESCYAWSFGENLLCTLEETQGHTHTETCYDPGHKHEESCYAWSYGEAIICTLAEGPGHTHIDSCYTPGHTHSDECYAWSLSEAVACGQDESAGHTHGDTCYTKNTNLACSVEESSGHPQHGDGCYDADGNVICPQTISEGHTHGNTCYAETSELTCQTAESAGHTHTETCREQVKGELICQTAESAPALVCGLEESAAHTHGEACHEKIQGELTCEAAESDPSLICQEEESAAHSHIEACYEKIQGELTCTETEREPTVAEPQLICEKEVIISHLHDEECYADPEELDENGELLTAAEPETEDENSDEAEEAAQEAASSTAESTETAKTEGSPAPAEDEQLPLTDDTAAPAADTDASESSETAAPAEGTETALAEDDPGEEAEPEEKVLICTAMVVDVHQHTEACFVVPDGPGCGLEEHLHINDCFPDREPPVEIQAEWEAALPAVTGKWDADLAAVAMTQVGYTESSENRIADETGAIRGYTRYGHLAETPHAPWQTLFLSFCLRYAGIPQDAIPVDADLSTWLEALSTAQLLREAPAASPAAEEPAEQDAAPIDQPENAGSEPAAEIAETDAPVEDTEAELPAENAEPAENPEAEVPAGNSETEVQPAQDPAEVRPQPGDLVFLDRDGDLTPDAAAILVEATDETGASVLAAIEGDYDDAVALLPYDAGAVRYFVSVAQARKQYFKAHPELKAYTLSFRGEDYTVTVQFGDASGFPEDVQLSVRELAHDSEEYQLHAAQVIAAEENNAVSGLRLFDISFLDAQGQEIEPAADVDVQILYDTSFVPDLESENFVVHFDKTEGMETVDINHVSDESGVQGFEFSLDSFSIVGSGTRTITTSQQVTFNVIETTPTATTGTLSMADISSDTALRTTDAVTMNDWSKYFGNDPSNFKTENAGGIFNDKSVTAGSVTYNNGTISPDSDKFLVGLSTIGSTQSVSGLQSSPTDVIFVLDMSSSMYGGGAEDGYTNSDGDWVAPAERNPETVQSMINALNESINHLNILNAHNRVGVVLYWGYHTVTAQSTDDYSEVLLPLDRYTAASDSTFLSVHTVFKHNTNKLSGIYVTDGVKNSAGTTLNGSNSKSPYYHSIKTGEGNAAYTAGTYAQQGIINAMGEFKKADTTVREAGKDTDSPRRPVFVFMTDGKPTASTANFSTGGDAQWGSNQEARRNSAESDFVTQLTAAYAKETVNQHYSESRDAGNPALFYSLGLGQNDVLALDILNAGNVTVTASRANEKETEDAKTENISAVIAGYWDDLVNDSSHKASFTVVNWTASWGKTYTPFEVERKDLNGRPFPWDTSQQKYVDKYFNAQTQSELSDAFSQIMLAISLQSKYSTTNIQSNDYQNSGDLSFVDTIGEYMTVTDVVGLIFNGTLYDGSNFANLLTGDLGNINGGTTLGVALSKVIQNDFNVTYGPTDGGIVDTAVELIDAAYNVGQLSRATGSNYIEWYATMDSDGDHQFLSFSHSSGDCGYTCTNHTTPPARAQYRIRSYYYYGDLETSETGALADTNLVYAQVWHRTRLSDGQESMLMALPAALLPTVDYEVGLDMSKKPIALTVSGAATPAMLLYEVGLNPRVTQNDVLPAVKAVANAQAAVKTAVENAIAAYKSTGTLAETVTVNGAEYAIKWKMRANTETPELYSNGEPIPLAIASGAVGSDSKIKWDETGGMIALDKQNQPIAEAVHDSLLTGYHLGIKWKYTKDDSSYVQLGNTYYRPLADVIYFYTNDFDTSNVYNSSVNTFSYFQPNIKNDRYYYTGPVNEIEGSGTFIYDREHKLIDYKPDSSSSSSSDYFERFVYYTCKDGVKTEHIEWKPISRSALVTAEADSEGHYFIPAGTPHDMTQSTAETYVQTKPEGNRTGTQTFSDYPYIHNGSRYLIGSVQGNNGRLNIWPVKFTGTKSMSGIKDLSNYKFEFELYRTGPDFKTDGITPSQTVFNTGELGTEIEFANVWVTTVNNSHYVIREKKNDAAGVVFDETEYHITVVLGGFEEGKPTFQVSWHKKGSDQDSNDLTKFDFSNKLGVELPETGGAGTELFILCGMAMMAAAVMIFLSKRKSFQGM